MEDRIINLLLISDDQANVINVQQAFKQNKITNPLYIAADGLKALEMLRGNGTPIPIYRRLVLLDLNTSKINGIEFLRELRADLELKLTPVVALATAAQERQWLAVYNLNVAGYILKPVIFSKFVAAIATLNRYWTLSEMP